MRILISGGGIAGLTAAYWLEKQGIKPVVIERANGMRQTGYGIDFFGTGYDVAERMGILETLHAHHLAADYIAFVEADGKPIAQLGMETILKATHDRYMPLMHHTLEHTLYNAVRDKVEVRFDTSIRLVNQSPDAVTVEFDSGAQETFDLLVGADGIHSNVRDLVFGPESEFAYFMGYYVASYTLPDHYDVGKGWSTYGEPGRQFGLYPNDRPNEIVPLFVWKGEDEGTIPREKRLEKLRSVFAGMGWLTEKILTDTPDSTDIFMDTVTQIRMKGWSRGRVMLVGDACACPTLISGQGASLAMGGGYLLAEELSRNANYGDAFAYFEDRMRPQTDLRQEKARGVARLYVPGSELGLTAQHLVLRVIFRELFAGVIAHELMATSILQSEALHRLPESHDAVLGYRVAGKLEATDYETLRLDMEYHLAKEKKVRLLLQLDEINGISRDAVLDDFEFGRDYRNVIEKLALVGDSRLATWGTIFAERFYARQVRHFGSGERKAAWEWLASDSHPSAAA